MENKITIEKQAELIVEELEYIIRDNNLILGDTYKRPIPPNRSHQIYYIQFLTPDNEMYKLTYKFNRTGRDTYMIYTYNGTQWCLLKTYLSDSITEFQEICKILSGAYDE